MMIDFILGQSKDGKKETLRLYQKDNEKQKQINEHFWN